MRAAKSTYELSRSQVQTPLPVVKFFWKLMKQFRPKLNSVLDMGAGDGRFALGGHYKNYVGVEIDDRDQIGLFPERARIIRDCAFRFKRKNFDACIGNPPYVRHHDIEHRWRNSTISLINSNLNINLNAWSNLYIYFFCLGIMKSKPDGVVALLTPFDWIARPSAVPLRDLIKTNSWQVSVYCFKESIFSNVLTTAAITIIDKATRSSAWKFYNVDTKFSISPRLGVADNKKPFLEYASRPENLWASRGISTGSQRIFTLTEGERLHAGLKLKDVAPCVTSLKHVPRSLRVLNKTSFKKYFIDAGKRCWLIRSDRNPISESLRGYLNGIPAKDRETYTCLNQTPWYAYRSALPPQILFNSGFTGRRTKVLKNLVKARSVGVVYGVYCKPYLSVTKLSIYLAGYNFNAQIVPHANLLRKVEVKQLNSVLSTWFRKHKNASSGG
jgi:hypothetical protein